MGYDIERCNLGNITQGLCNVVQGSISTAPNPSIFDPTWAPGQVSFSEFGFVVAEWSVYTFLVAFVVATVYHAAVGVWRKQYWVIPTLSLGAAIEAIGWGGRLMAHMNLKWSENLGGFWEYDETSFIMQVVTLIIAPTLFSAANYIILGKSIRATGSRYSILTPRSFAIWFMFADFVCLAVQGAGGGIAGGGEGPDDADLGAKIMTGGVVLQLAVTVAFVILLGDFVRRYVSRKPAVRQFHPLPNKGFFKQIEHPTPMQLVHRSSDMSNETGQSTPPAKLEATGSGPFEEAYIKPGHVWLIISGLLFTTTLIVIRSVYRSVELTDGWRGPIAVNQPLFLGLDAFLMAMLVWVYFVHPAFYLPRQKL